MNYDTYVESDTYSESDMYVESDPYSEIYRQEYPLVVKRRKKRLLSTDILVSLIGIGVGIYFLTQTGQASTIQEITATSMTLDKTSCTSPCTINTNITWKNNGTVSETFNPGIKVDGVLTNLSPVTLVAGESVTKPFQTTGLTIGSHLICPDPN